MVGKVQYDEMQDQWRVGSFYLMFRAILDRNALFPVFQLLIEFANGVQKLAVRLLCCASRVKSFVYSTLDYCESTHDSEKVDFTLAIRKWNIADIIRWLFAGKVDIHIIVILDWRPPGSKTQTLELN